MVKAAELDKRVLEALIDLTPGELNRYLGSCAFEMVGDIKDSMGTSPSEPGDPPGVDTNALRGGITPTPEGELTYYIHDQVEYGVYLELGVEENNLKPRPFITPVFEEWRARKFYERAKALKLKP